MKILPQVLDLISEKQTVMDVGSTKSGIVTAIKNHPKRKRYVAFHPMWGTENSGKAKICSKESFSGRAAVICDKEDSAEDAFSLVEKVAKTLEMNTIFMASEARRTHSLYFSYLSYYFLCFANTVLEKEREEDTIFQLASSGFSSTVRLANLIQKCGFLSSNKTKKKCA